MKTLAERGHPVREFGTSELKPRGQDVRAPIQMRRLAFSSLLAIFILLGSMVSRAEDAAALFNDANKLYEQGKFDEASVAYEKLIQTGSVTTPAYFNLGNAYLKSGKMGRAIAAYRQGETLSPRDPDVRANLQFAREQAGGGKQSTPVWQKWIKRLTLNEWTIAASIAVSLWFLVLTVRVLRGGSRKSFCSRQFLTGLIAGGLLILLIVAVRLQLFQKSSVVVVPEAVIRRGPLPESQSAFTLRDGAEVTVIGKKGEWLQVLDASERTGWLPEKQVMIISGK